jgi:DNA polymerase-3 subunit delta'
VPATLDTVLGQATALETLRRALATGRTHHAYLFDGPEGVGKERAAFGLAQCLVCERPSAGLACGSCSACGRAVPAEPGGLPLHPDIAVLGRGLYEPAQIGRKTPESREISIDQVRTIVLSRAAFPPHEGRARVFIVRAADELGVSAANALLKTLEEPHRATTFVLLTARKGSLLSTIRSRALALRFGALPLAVVAEVLVAGGLAPEAAARAAADSGGSVARARELADAEISAALDGFIGRVRAAIDAPSASEAYALAEDGKKGKAELPLLLGGLALAFARDAREAARGRGAASPEVHAGRYDLAMRAMKQLHANGSTQLVMESLLLGLRASAR